jgi:hypothetical protein
MARLAGDRLKNATGKEGMSSADVVTALAALGGIGGLTVTGIVNLLDYFTGDATIGNSGEYLANSAITAIPLGTAATGVGAAMALDPVARELVGVIGDTAAARQVASQYGGDAVMSLLSRGESGRPDAQAVEQAAGKVNERVEGLIQALRQQAGKDQKMSGLPPDLAAEALVKRSGHNLARAAGIGALAGSVPAVMLMQDQRGPTQRTGGS